MRALFWKFGMVEAFRLWLQGKGLAHKSILNYVGFATQWVAWCKLHEVDYLAAGRPELTWYLGEHVGSHRPTTTACLLLGLRQFYDYLVAEGHVRRNPARDVRAPRREPRPTEPFTQDELRRMYEACKTWRERAIYLLLATAGLRKGEIYGLRRDDVSVETGSVRVMGKRSKFRYVRPGPIVLAALSNALAFEETLCPFASDQYIWRLVKELAARANVRGRIYPHRFRHSFATNFLDAGGTIEELQIVLGHERIEQSLFYAKAGRQQRALVRMESLDLPARLLGPGVT